VFEVLGPLIELSGYVVSVIALLLGRLSLAGSGAAGTGEPGQAWLARSSEPAV